MSVINVDTIQLPKKTEAAWIAANPVLLDGEQVFVDVAGVIKIKVGDGVKTFNQLDYFTGGDAGASNASEATKGIVEEATSDEVAAGTGVGSTGARLFVNPGKLITWWTAIKAALTKSDVGLGNVNNTADADKPVSTAQAAALALKVDKVDGKSLSTEDYTSAEKAKLAAIDATHYGAPLQTTAQLATITAANRTDKQRHYVEDDLSDYFYDATAVAGDITPDDQAGGVGFWRKVAVGGESAASIKAKYESNADTNAYTDAEKAKVANMPDDFNGAGLPAGGTEGQVLTKQSLTDGDADWVTLDSSAVSLAELGTIVTDDFNRASLGADWTNTGTATFSIVGNQLEVSRSGAIATANYITYTPYGNSNLESFTVTSKIIAGTIDASSFGVGFGFESNGVYQKCNIRVVVRLDTANLGKIQYYQTSFPSNQTATSVNGLTIIAGDELALTIKFIKNKFITTVLNVTTNQSNTFELNSSTTYGNTYAIPNSFRYTIIAVGGTHLIDNYKVDGNDLKGVDFLLVGDSITKGLTTSSIFKRWGEVVNDVSNTITQTNAGSGNVIEDINAAEVLALEPKKILLLIGINNIQNGNPAVLSILDKYSTLVDSLVAGGYVIGSTLFIGLLTPGPNYHAPSAAFVPTLNAGLISAYGSATIDFNTALRDASTATVLNTAYTIDGIHPSDDGHNIMANIFINRMQLPAKPKKQTNVFPVQYNQENGYVIIGEGINKSTKPGFLLELIGTDSFNAASSSQVRMGRSIGSKGGFLGSAHDSAMMIGGGARASSNYELLIAANADGSAITMGGGGGLFHAFTGKNPGAALADSRRGRWNSLGFSFWGAGAITDPLSVIDCVGSFGTNITTKIADYTATVADHTILADATAGNVIITLPSATGVTRRMYIIKKIDSSANTVTIQANGVQTIDGANTQVLSAQWDKKSIQSNGAAWYIV